MKIARNAFHARNFIVVVKNVMIMEIAFNLKIYVQTVKLIINKEINRVI